MLINGERNIVKNVTIRGSGDALQANGSTYFEDIHLVGGGDTILGRGAAFFRRATIESQGAFMWIHNGADSHGNVFIDSTFRGIGKEPTALARLPDNKGRNYPYAEVVLLRCMLSASCPKAEGRWTATRAT